MTLRLSTKPAYIVTGCNFKKNCKKKIKKTCNCTCVQEVQQIDPYDQERYLFKRSDRDKTRRLNTGGTLQNSQRYNNNNNSSNNYPTRVKGTAIPPSDRIPYDQSRRACDDPYGQNPGGRCDQPCGFDRLDRRPINDLGYECWDDFRRPPPPDFDQLGLNPYVRPPCGCDQQENAQYFPPPPPAQCPMGPECWGGQDGYDRGRPRPEPYGCPYGRSPSVYGGGRRPTGLGYNPYNRYDAYNRGGGFGLDDPQRESLASGRIPFDHPGPPGFRPPDDLIKQQKPSVRPQDGRAQFDHPGPPGFRPPDDLIKQQNPNYGPQDGRAQFDHPGPPGFRPPDDLIKQQKNNIVPQDGRAQFDHPGPPGFRPLDDLVKRQKPQDGRTQFDHPGPAGFRPPDDLVKVQTPNPNQYQAPDGSRNKKYPEINPNPNRNTGQAQTPATPPPTADYYKQQLQLDSTPVAPEIPEVKYRPIADPAPQDALLQSNLKPPYEERMLDKVYTPEGKPITSTTPTTPAAKKQRSKVGENKNYLGTLDNNRPNSSNRPSNSPAARNSQFNNVNVANNSERLQFENGGPPGFRPADDLLKGSGFDFANTGTSNARTSNANPNNNNFRVPTPPSGLDRSRTNSSMPYNIPGRNENIYDSGGGRGNGPPNNRPGQTNNNYSNINAEARASEDRRLREDPYYYDNGQNVGQYQRPPSPAVIWNTNRNNNYDNLSSNNYNCDCNTSSNNNNNDYYQSPNNNSWDMNPYDQPPSPCPYYSSKNSYASTGSGLAYSAPNAQYAIQRPTCGQQQQQPQQDLYYQPNECESTFEMGMMPPLSQNFPCPYQSNGNGKGNGQVTDECETRRAAGTAEQCNNNNNKNNDDDNEFLIEECVVFPRRLKRKARRKLCPGSCSRRQQVPRCRTATNTCNNNSCNSAPNTWERRSCVPDSCATDDTNDCSNCCSKKGPTFIPFLAISTES